MMRAGFDHRRRLAMSALLLASFLEFCGCSPVTDYSQVRQTIFASTKWDAVLRLCVHCIDPRKVEAADVGEPVLHEDQNLSFYRPTQAQKETQTQEAFPFTTSLLLDTKPIQWPIPESVYFIYTNDTTSAESVHRSSVATAFVLSVPDRRHRQFKRFLVTARHVIDPEWAHCTETNPESIVIRLNKRIGGVGYETVQLQLRHQQQFFAAADGTSDLAVIALDKNVIPNLDDYKFIDVPFSMLPTDSELQTIQPNQQVMTAGLRAGPPVEAGNYPVFDPGMLATMPDGDVNIRCASQLAPRPLRVWFINAAIPQGVSGAPVYTAMGRGAKSMTTPILIGIQSVSWPERGVAGITPSAALSELVESALADRRPEMDFYKGPDR